MIPEFAYFLKVNVAFTLFYAFYRLFFYKDTFFKLRRVILLSFFGLSLSYPLLDIQEWLRQQEPMADVVYLYSVVLPEVVGGEAGGLFGNGSAWIMRLLVFLYVCMLVSLCLRFLIQLGGIIRLARVSQRKVVHGFPVYELAKAAGPFSFFRMIFLHPGSHSDKEIDEILTHERTHVSQWHSIDVILSELVCVVCWFNPFAWLLKREVRHNLEYLADNTVIQSGYDSKSYQYHLLGLAHHQAATVLYNNFNVLHLKNRVQMMNQKRSAGIGRAKYLLFIPLAGILVLVSNMDSVARFTARLTGKEVPVVNEEKAVANEEKVVANEVAPKPDIPENENTFSEQVFTVVEHMPQFPGGDSELLKFIATNVKYPKDAQDKGVSGRVICSFIVGSDGLIYQPQIVRGVSPELDKEALRVVRQMPEWTPGKQRGKSVAVKYTVPITFRLQ